MTRYRILPYKKGSRSAKALAEALGGKVLKIGFQPFHLAGSYKPRQSDVVVNWGCSQFNEDAEWGGIGPTVFNGDTDLLKEVTNKLNFFNLLESQGFSDIIPPFWTNQEDIPNEDFPVVCRTILSGHSGSGIVIADNRDGLVAAPLYVKYVKKKDEYRVHVGLIGEKNGYPYSEGSPFATIIAVQRKARRLGFENPNWQVRNHSNGFVYVRENVNPPQLVIEAAKKAFEASSLDFGAVDVIWNEHEGKAYVLEINTAPGLEGQTVTDYANFFKGLI